MGHIKYCFFAFRRKFYFEESKTACCVGIKWTAWKVVGLKKLILLEDQVEDTRSSVGLHCLFTIIVNEPKQIQIPGYISAA